MNYKLLTGGLVAAFLLPMSAQAAVVGCSVTSGTPTLPTCVELVPPASVGTPANPSNSVNYIQGNAVTLTVATAAILNSGIVSGAAVPFVQGQWITSDLVNYNPVASPGTVVAKMTFAGKVLGVIRTAAGLAATHVTNPFLAVSNVTYNFGTVGSGLETPRDVVTISGNSVTFDLRSTSNNDNFSVITAVPEPSTWMMLLFGFGLAGYALRRRRGNVAVSFS
jgi:hypothetical protein